MKKILLINKPQKLGYPKIFTVDYDEYDNYRILMIII